MSNERYVPTKLDFRNYMQFFSGQMVSMLGSSIVSFTIIWLLSKMKQIDPIVEELEAKEKAAKEQEKKIPTITIEREIDEIPVALALD